MKKGVSFLLALSLLLGLTACGGKEKDAWDGGLVYLSEPVDYVDGYKSGRGCLRHR